MSFEKWLRQPKTITGLAALVGTLAGIASGVLTHKLGIGTGAGAAVFAIVHLVMPGDKAAAQSAADLIRDGVQAAVTNHLQQAMPQLATDGAALVGAFARGLVQPVSAAPPVAPAPPPASPPAPTAPADPKGTPPNAPANPSPAA